MQGGKVDAVASAEVPAEAFKIAGAAVKAFAKLSASVKIQPVEDGAAVSESEPSTASITVPPLDLLPSIVYCRVDLLSSNDGRFMVSEFESLDPELFFRLSSNIAPALVAGIVKALKRADRL